MHKISEQLDSLFSEFRLATEKPSSDQLAILDYTKNFAKPYDGDWTAPWLLSEWNSPRWVTSAGAKTRLDADGKWLGTFPANWNVLLPDGHLLTDNRYKLLLETAKKCSFLYRHGVLDRRPPALGKWNLFNMNLTNLCTWLVLNESKYLPAEYGFALLDNAAVNQILCGYVEGGWCEVNAIILRCLSVFYEKAYGEPCPQHLLDETHTWPNECREKIIEWIESEDGYKRDRGKGGLISREFIANLINASTVNVARHQKLDVVLRQFEPELFHPTLLVSAWNSNEYPGHKTKLLEHVRTKKMTKTSLKNVYLALSKCFSAYPHLPMLLPRPDSIKVNECYLSAVKQTHEDGHNAFIPLDDGLKLLNEALRWVYLYGDDLVSYYLEIMSRLAAKAQASTSKTPWKTAISQNSRKIMQEVRPPVALLSAGFSFNFFSRPSGKAGDFKNFRENPSLQEALEVYMGCVVSLIAFLKPSRDIEICNLEIDCLLESSPGRFWLDSDMAKRSVGGMRAKSGGKPIPVITAKALQQVQRLSIGIADIYGEEDEFKRKKLFYFPSHSKWGVGVLQGSGGLNTFLDKLCDFIELPLDEYGRRMYVRIHEMRKWFLLLLFWSGKYDVLDAARWIAGHTDVKHIYAYIEREFPKEQIGKLEAQCAVEYLAKFDQTRVETDEGEIGLSELHERLLKMLNVDSLSLVKESEWHHLVEELFDEEYHLEPFTIEQDDGSKKLTIAIRVGKR